MAWKTAFILVALGAAAAGAPAQAQQAAKAGDAGRFAIDAALAKAGKTTFASKACTACHAVGKKLVGPDLNGVFERRSVDWLKKWLKDPDGMMAKDSTAKALLAEYQGIKMPNLNLTDTEIEALLHYLASEQKPAK